MSRDLRETGRAFVLASEFIYHIITLKYDIIIIESDIIVIYSKLALLNSEGLLIFVNLLYIGNGF